MTLDSIAAEFWSPSRVRALAIGTPAPPITNVDAIVAAIWSRSERTLFPNPIVTGTHARVGHGPRILAKLSTAPRIRARLVLEPQK